MSEGTLSCTEFEEAQGLVGHVIDILALPRPLMNGLREGPSAPSRAVKGPLNKAELVNGRR